MKPQKPKKLTGSLCGGARLYPKQISLPPVGLGDAPKGKPDMYIIPTQTEKTEKDAVDFATLTTPDPAPVPSHAPAPDAPVGEWALWLHAVGYRVAEMSAENAKHRAKTYDSDDGCRRTAMDIRSAWGSRPGANLALLAGYQRDTTALAVVDADGPVATAYVETLFGPTYPRCSHPSSTGAKFFVQMPVSWDGKTARLIVPGCANSGHDGLELLGLGRTATVAPVGTSRRGSIPVGCGSTCRPGRDPYDPGRDP